MSENVETKMAEQLSGFRTLASFRRFAYQATAVTALIAGAVTGSREGAQKGLTTALIGLVIGIAGARLLTAPFGAYLWYRNWKCPACKKRLGMGPAELCPNCGARLFSAR